MGYWARVCSGGVSTLVKEAWRPGRRVRRRRVSAPSGKTAKLRPKEQIITAFGHVLWLGQLGVAQTKQSQDTVKSALQKTKMTFVAICTAAALVDLPE